MIALSPTRLVAGVLLLSSGVESFFSTGTAKSAPAVAVTPSKIDRTENPQWLDSLKYEGEPNFDVLQKTIDFANCRTFEEVKVFYDKEHVFRGPIIGPLNTKDLEETQKGFNVYDAYPDLENRPFGFTIDPDNPYRCYYMERWEGTNTGSLTLGPATIPPTNNQVQCPTHVMSLNWTPQGKVIYTCLSAPLDRWEGTTKGGGAVIGLLAGAGTDSGNDTAIGSPMLRFQQRVVHMIGSFGRNWSVEEGIPDWWKSKSRGADPNDM